MYNSILSYRHVADWGNKTVQLSFDAIDITLVRSSCVLMEVFVYRFHSAFQHIVYPGDKIGQMERDALFFQCLPVIKQTYHHSLKQKQVKEQHVGLNIA